MNPLLYIMIMLIRFLLLPFFMLFFPIIYVLNKMWFEDYRERKRLERLYGKKE